MIGIDVWYQSYIHTYIYIYTRVFPCASAHGEDVCVSCDVATIVSETYPTVLSQFTKRKTHTTNYYHNSDRNAQNNHENENKKQKRRRLRSLDGNDRPVMRACSWRLQSSTVCCSQQGSVMLSVDSAQLDWARP